MPVSNPTSLDSNRSLTSGTSLTSLSVSPTANALLVAVTFNYSSFGAKDVDTMVSNSGLNTSTWTKIAEYDSTGASRPSVSMWWATADGTPGSGTITATWDQSTDTRQLNILEMASGFNSTTPVGQETGGDITTDASPQFTFTSTPDSDSILLAAWACNDADSGAPDSGWTELEDTASGNIMTYLAWAAGSNGDSAGVTWTGSTQATQAYMGLEISPEAASSGGALPLINAYYS